MPERIAAVIKAKRAAFHEEADVSAVSIFIANDLVVLCHGRLDLPVVFRIHIAFSEGKKVHRSTLQTLQHLTADRMRMVKTIAGTRRGQRHERVTIEMIRVHMAGGDAADAGETCGVDAALRHPNMRLVGGGILDRQRIGQIGIEEHPLAVPLHEKAALPQPPNMQHLRPALCGGEVGNQGIIFLQRGDHARPVRRTE